MRRQGNLFDKVITFDNLLLAAHKAMKGKRDKRAVAAFYFNLENELISLQHELKDGSYKPRPFTQFEIREPKPRRICSSNFRDRVVHHAICNFVEPIFERRAIFDNYACRMNKGSHMAVTKCQKFAKSHLYFLKCDIRKFFESIDHGTLKKLLLRILKDKKLLKLIDRIIDHEVPGNLKGRGLPIGNLTSQHFANLYLGELDHFVKERRQVKGYVRYMDDFILFSNEKKSLHILLKEIEQFVNEQLRLELKPKATMIAPVTEGIPFLGFRIFPNVVRIKRENLVRMRQKIRLKERLFAGGKLDEKNLILSISSIIGHVSHVNSLAIRREIFEQSLKLA